MKKRALIIFLMTTTLFAQENQIRLNESVITSQNFGTTVRNTASNITIITAKEIKEKGAMDLIDALRMAPGILVKNYYGSIALDIGGYSSTHAYKNNIITIDGVKSDQFDSSIVPIDLVERIEVIPNGGGVLYGDGASGGVINIVTKNMYGNNKKKISGNVRTEIGSYNSYKYGLTTIVNPSEKFALKVTYSNKKHNSWRKFVENDRRLYTKYETVSLLGNYKFDNSDLLLNYTRNDRKLVFGNELPEELYKKDRSKVLKKAYSGFYQSDNFYGKYKRKIGDNTEFLTYAKYSDKVWKKLNKDKRYHTYEKSIKAQIKQNYEDKNYFIIGADYFDSVRERYAKLKEGHVEKTGKNDVKKEFGIFAMNETNFGKLTFAQGLRYGKTEHEYYWSRRDPIPEGLKGKKGCQKYDNWAGDLELRYNYSNTGMMYGKISRAFRTPINQEAGNTYNAQKLKSQIQKNFEIGVKDYIGDNIYLSASTFYKKIDGEIYYQTTVDKATGKTGAAFYNMGDTRRIGLQLLSEQYLGKLTLTESISYLNHKIEKSDFKTRENKEIPMVPNWKLGFGINYKYNDKLNLGADVVYVGKYYDSSDATNERKKDLGGYTTVDVSANYQLDDKISVVARVNNLFDEKYEDFVGYWSNTRQLTPAVGRNFSIGLDYKF